MRNETVWGWCLAAWIALAGGASAGEPVGDQARDQTASMPAEVKSVGDRLSSPTATGWKTGRAYGMTTAASIDVALRQSEPGDLAGGGAARGGPTNDDCATSISIFDGVTPFSTEGASTDGEPMPNHPSCDAANDDNVNQDIWYDYTATCLGTLTISTCNDANFDTKLAIYDGLACPATGLIDCNDDGTGCFGYTSTLEAFVVAGEAYKIRVGGYAGNTGTGNLTVTCVAGHSACEDATGDCCDPAGNGTPGCEGGQCCQLVCATNEFCCDVEWDSACAAAAAEMCPICDGGGPCGPGAGDCCVANGTPGCENVACCQTVCAGDAWCCQVEWDVVCANAAMDACPGCGQGGGSDQCGDAEIISEGTHGVSNIGATTDGPPHSECLAYDDNQVGSDVWFDYTASFTGIVDVGLCGSLFDTKLAVYEGCQCPVTDARLLACNDDSCSGTPQSAVSVPVVASGCYKVRIGGYMGGQGYGTLTIEQSGEPCEADCPPGAMQEPEACGDETNGGCNMDVPAFTALECGETVCGSAWADGGHRDTDWYQVVVTAETEITWSVTTEFDGIIGFVETIPPGSDDCEHDTGFLEPYSFGGDCEPYSVSQVVSPGTYWLFVASAEFNGLPCSGDPGNGYVATATWDCVEQCPTGPVEWVDPPDSVVDAGKPHNVEGGPVQGIDRMLVAAPEGAAADCFTLCENHDGGLGPNSITSVVNNGDGTYTVLLSRPITPLAVTTITYTDDDSTPWTGTFTAHPGNVNGDAGAGPIDILDLIDYLNGMTLPWGAYSCDVDRSEECNPGDILTVIDLLNGAGEYPAYNGTALPGNTICP